MFPRENSQGKYLYSYIYFSLSPFSYVLLVYDTIFQVLDTCSRWYSTHTADSTTVQSGIELEEIGVCPNKHCPAKRDLDLLKARVRLDRMHKAVIEDLCRREQLADSAGTNDQVVTSSFNQAVAIMHHPIIHAASLVAMSDNGTGARSKVKTSPDVPIDLRRHSMPLDENQVVIEIAERPSSALAMGMYRRFASFFFLYFYIPRVCC